MRKTLLAAASTALLLGLAAPAQAADTIVVGASGDYSQLRSHTGSALAQHRYGKLNGSAINDVEFVNIETTVNWSQVANGSQDSNLRRWANALKGRGSIMVSWSHEPMAKQNTHWGTASSFIASFRHVVHVFDNVGATNVKWVWNATSDSFRGTRASGANWYPGDNVVDYVAGESYNRCGNPDASFANRIKEILAFAGKHDKKFVAAEFASKPTGRAAWIRAATSYMNSNRGKFAGAFYFNSNYGGCSFKLSSGAEFDALRNMINTL